MDSIEILGGTSLDGEIAIQGSKNAALPMLAAAVLNRGVTVLHNCPKIIDVFYMIKILEHIGCSVKWEGSTLIIEASQVNGYEIPEDYANKMRSSVILSGALLGRQKKAVIPYPGGCVIGSRPIDLHLKAFQTMDVSIHEREENIVLETTALVGATISLKIPSVGATENILLAAACAEGTTRVLNAAREPEITELAKLLIEMGADITGAGTEEIIIRGVQKLHDVEVTIIPDRIAAGTYILAAIGTRGKISVLNPPMEHIKALLQLIVQMGATYEHSMEGLLIDGRKADIALPFVETLPYPGFPTDLQSPLISVLTLIKGTSKVRENIFEARFKSAMQLKKMGANLEIGSKEVVIHGVTELTGTEVFAEELRGGAALVLAGLMAQGKTKVNNIHYIRRGYIDICEDLRSLGANIYETNECQNENHYIT